MGGYDFHFTPEMAAAAAKLGIRLPACDTVAGATPELVSYGMDDSLPATVTGIAHGSAVAPAFRLGNSPLRSTSVSGRSVCSANRRLDRRPYSDSAMHSMAE
jgi:hypothetical protein